MNAFIVQLVAFVNNGQTGTLLSSAETTIGNHDLGVIAINLLTWLRAESKHKSDRPLQLKVDHTWCKNIVRLVREDPTFAQMFFVEDNELCFAENIDPVERRRIQNYANEHYKPRLMTRASSE